MHTLSRFVSRARTHSTAEFQISVVAQNHCQDLSILPVEPALRAAILNHVAGDFTTTQEPGFLTSVRHHKLVNDALTSLLAATNAVAARVPHEMLLLDLYAALRPLDEITGATTTDDILNLIFSTFCIGK